MRISVFGLGYVGAVSCGCLAALGHEVVGVDVVEGKVRSIQSGKSPIVEKGLDQILAEAVRNGTLRATTDVAEAVRETEVALVCVGTPSTPSGGVDSRHLERVCRQIGNAVRGLDTKFFTVMNRSTSLPDVHQSLMDTLEMSSGSRLGDRIGYVCHPEFLREGSALSDFFDPPKIVFGATDSRSQAICQDLYPGISAKTFYVSPSVAAMVKYADNSFHAVKVTFGNEIGLICKALAIDSHALMDIFCEDHKLNISDKYLKPGNPFGGSCLPNDLRALLDLSRCAVVPLPMHAGMLESNRQQIEYLVKRILATSGRRTVGLIGLAFKEGTDDVRESPGVYLAEQLIGKGVSVAIYDQDLALANMVGSNRNFVLDTLPHLADLLSNDFAQVVGCSSTLVVSHRLSAERWEGVRIRPDHHILDLVNVPALQGHNNYDGLYW